MRKERGCDGETDGEVEKEKGSWNPMIPILQQRILETPHLLKRDPRVIIWLLIHTKSDYRDLLPINIFQGKATSFSVQKCEKCLPKGSVQRLFIRVSGYLETPSPN